LREVTSITRERRHLHCQGVRLGGASTGANEKTLIKKGLVKGRDYETVIISQNSHASYYPGAVPMNLKLIFSADGKKIFGAQIVGGEAVDKRIDTIAVSIRLGGTVHDLKSLELAYAPPFSSAKYPVNMAGFTAENVLTGKVAFSAWMFDFDGQKCGRPRRARGHRAPGLYASGLHADSPRAAAQKAQRARP
jgi:hypothetical protein